MEQEQEVYVDLEISEVNKEYWAIDSAMSLPQDISKLLIRQTYFFFVLQLRTGIKEEDLPKIRNFFLSLCEEIFAQDLRGVSFLINGQHHPIKIHSIPALKDLFAQHLLISKEDDYSKTLVQTRHAVQAMAQKLQQTKISLFFFFSHTQIDHSLGVKKRSYIDQLNQHNEICREEVNHLAKTVRHFTNECKTYIVSYDREGEDEQDYSMSDTQLMNLINVRVGQPGSFLSRNYSYAQMNSTFDSLSALMLFKLYTLDILLPTIQNQETSSKFTQKVQFTCSSPSQVKGGSVYIKKQHLDLQKLKEGGLTIAKGYRKESDELEEKIETTSFKANITFGELQPARKLISQAKVHSLELDRICRILSQKIVSYHRIYAGGKSHLNMEFDRELFLQMRDRVAMIYDCSKELFEAIREGGFKGKEQLSLYQAYNSFKLKIDKIEEVLVGILKKQLGGSEIGQLSQAVSLTSIKNSLRHKLVRRINANPFLLDQVYRQVEDIVDKGGIDFPQLMVDSSSVRKSLGNCVISDKNVVTAMCSYDALGVAFQIQRPMSAIADPGRIKIRQVSPSLMSASSFFQKFLYKIEYTPNIISKVFQKCHKCKSKYCTYFLRGQSVTHNIAETKVESYTSHLHKMHGIDHWNQNPSQNDFQRDCRNNQENLSKVTREIDYLRDVGQLQRQNYQEKWDYVGRAESIPSVLGFMPLYLHQDHWKVARHLMKPCLGFTATGQPLGYSFAQFQNIPFMLLSSTIRACKELQYQQDEQLQAVKNCKDQIQLQQMETVINLQKSRMERLQHIRQALEVTCTTIMVQLSSQKAELPLVDLVRERLENYKEPINRTVDIIPNNSAFLGQLYVAFQGKMLKKPNEQEFNWFFLRLVEEELRRETDGWKEEETQDAFVDKLLNLDAKAIRNNQNQVVVTNSGDFALKFQEALEGQRARQEQIEIRKQELEMMLRKEGQWNDNQRLTIIEYKRLYVNRVLWMWYVRFLLYQEKDRGEIHKWKSIGIRFAYMLFTLIIQNKKQWKNHQRREAILEGTYADPFDYYQAKQFLEDQFSALYNKILEDMRKEVQYKKAQGAAEVLALTGSLQQSAGVLLHSHDLQSQIFEAFWRQQVPRFAEKMEMMVHGVYRGVRFRKWIPSRKRMNALRRRYPTQFMRYQYKF